VNAFPLLASGDPVLFLMLGGILVLAGATIGVGSAGAILLFGKTAEKKRTGRRLLAGAAIPLLAAAIWWLAVVGFD
jgi:hypothetical protein